MIGLADLARVREAIIPAEMLANELKIKVSRRADAFARG
jgi:hypothetical protein